MSKHQGSGVAIPIVVGDTCVEFQIKLATKETEQLHVAAETSNIHIVSRGWIVFFPGRRFLIDAVTILDLLASSL